MQSDTAPVLNLVVILGISVVGDDVILLLSRGRRLLGSLPYFTAHVTIVYHMTVYGVVLCLTAIAQTAMYCGVISICICVS